MIKMILGDKTEFIIKEGASLGNVVAITKNFTELGKVATALTKTGNLSTLQFLDADVVTGEYNDMKLESPIFKEVDIRDNEVYAAFAIREKTEVEKRLDTLENGQEIQDGAIGDLGATVSEIAEGGNV